MKYRSSDFISPVYDVTVWGFFIIGAKLESLSRWVFAVVCESFGFSLSVRYYCLAAAIDQNEGTGSWCPSLTALADIPES